MPYDKTVNKEIFINAAKSHKIASEEEILKRGLNPKEVFQELDKVPGSQITTSKKGRIWHS